MANIEYGGMTSSFHLKTQYLKEFGGRKMVGTKRRPVSKLTVTLTKKSSEKVQIRLKKQYFPSKITCVVFWSLLFQFLREKIENDIEKGRTQKSTPSSFSHLCVFYNYDQTLILQLCFDSSLSNYANSCKLSLRKQCKS